MARESRLNHAERKFTASTRESRVDVKRNLGRKCDTALLIDCLREIVVALFSAVLRVGTVLLSSVHRARRSGPLWTAIITLMSTRACVPD